MSVRKWSQPAQRYPNGRRRRRFDGDGSAQTPNGTATSPTGAAARARVQHAWACLQMRLPCVRNCIAVMAVDASAEAVFRRSVVARGWFSSLLVATSARGSP